MLVFDIGKAAFSICPEVENGYIKSIITVNDEIWVGTNGSGIRIISASTGKELSAIEHTSNADAICSNAVYSLLKEDDMLLGRYLHGRIKLYSSSWKFFLFILIQSFLILII